MGRTCSAPSSLSPSRSGPNGSGFRRWSTRARTTHWFPPRSSLHSGWTSRRYQPDPAAWVREAASWTRCPGASSPPLPRGLAELLVAAVEAGAVREVDGAARQVDLLTVDLLEAHDEHRAVRLGEDGWADLDDVVGPDGEEEAIEGGVMELAQGDAVADQRLALGVAVGRDVGRAQELTGPCRLPPSPGRPGPMSRRAGVQWTLLRA